MQKTLVIMLVVVVVALIGVVVFQKLNQPEPTPIVINQPVVNQPVANQPATNQPSTNCVKEGESGSTECGDPSCYQYCCSGLTKISTTKSYNGICEGGVNNPGDFICSYCGNGVCGTGENQCNCPADCKDSEIVSWKTYTNDQYGFEVKYPSDFIFNEMSTAAWKFIQIEKKVSDNYYGYRISIAQDKTTKSLSDYYSGLSNTKIEMTNYVLSGSPAIKWVVMGEPNSKRITFIATEYKNRIYEVSDDITQFPNDESLKLFNDIISTFKFTK